MALICIDFDKTISSEHIFNIITAAIQKDPTLKNDLNRQWELVKSIAPIRSEEFIWQQVIQQLLKDGHEIAIVSFSSYRHIIQRYLAEVVGLKPQELNKIVVVAKMPLNPKNADKSAHITLAKHFTIGANSDNHNITLVDDDPKNLFKAAANNHHTILATAGGTHLTALHALSAALKKPTNASPNNSVNDPQLPSRKHTEAKTHSTSISNNFQHPLPTSSASFMEKSISPSVKHTPFLFKQSNALLPPPIPAAVANVHSHSTVSSSEIFKETPLEARQEMARENNIVLPHFSLETPKISTSKPPRKNLACSAPSETATSDRLLKCSA